jgi:hypothetical protein
MRVRFPKDQTFLKEDSREISPELADSLNYFLWKGIPRKVRLVIIYSGMLFRFKFQRGSLGILFLVHFIISCLKANYVAENRCECLRISRIQRHRDTAST